MAPKPSNNHHIPDAFWCMVCGRLEEKTSTPRVRLVNKEPARPGPGAGGVLFPTYRVGQAVLYQPHIAPTGVIETGVPIVDGRGKATASNGHPYVGYACNSGFQKLSASSHHKGQGSVELASLDDPHVTRQHVAHELEVRKAEVLANFEEQRKILVDEAASARQSLLAAESAFHVSIFWPLCLTGLVPQHLHYLYILCPHVLIP